ncbi:sce7726 family protein [Pseudomonas aeruginosa]|uniref:sce7726 family protein n=1 Tax=Pseudomonas aeruginosa TaxID=287 RepID=UPI0012987DF2|nr:sce7726 family protein [Pseudomonas aeruginosa]MBG4458870.1 sce7726 family protein [Pseudomonas aeruginosa]MBH8788150.1 sce7726 family protein [Pseudomonas aeruginosa]HBO4549576.1 sce7726 family protein [Pseudomonas aeruginosa]HBO4811790.1 sce7726 family protein [Pseudomonas aeruginosa]HCE9704554.1 sce7726 family protein [Pseudomonas aeruginosa]
MLNFNEIAKIFSSSNIISVSGGDLSLVTRVAKCYQDSFDDTFTVASVFDFCYGLLRREYRNEYYYKNSIAKKILLGRHSINSSTMLTEFRVGANKADCVIINGISTCYEIKTDYDNLTRLKSQIDSYLKIFDKVNVVVSKKNLTSVLHTTPEEVGVILLNKSGTFREMRSAKLTEAQIDVRVLMRSLRREEYVGLTESVFGAAPNVANTEIFRECERLLTSAANEKIRTEFRKIIRQTRALDKDFILSLPTSLLAAGVEFGTSRKARVGLVENMNSVLSKEALCTTQSSKANSLN